jgi:hypothetical protein
VPKPPAYGPVPDDAPAPPPEPPTPPPIFPPLLPPPPPKVESEANIEFEPFEAIPAGDPAPPDPIVTEYV